MSSGFSDAFVVAGEFNLSPPVPVSGQKVPLQVDSAGNVLVNVAVGGGGGGSNPSVGTDNTAAPTSSTQIGTQDAGGKLQAVSASNPAPVTGTLTNNNAAPGANHGAALTAVANAAAPSLTEGNETLLSVDLGGRLRTSAPSLVDANNSSTATLGSNGVFTGTGTDLLNYKALSIAVFADQNSAAGGFSVQFSEDNSHWDLTEAITITASTALTNQFTIRARFFRIVYTNGGVAQTAFRLQTLLHPAPIGVRLAPVSQTVLAADEALTTHSVVTGLSTGGGGTYVDVKVNPSGTLATQDGMDVTPGTTSAPSVTGVVAGKTNDATPQYQPIPEGAGGRSVIVEGVAGGVAQPVSESGNWNVNQAIGSAGFEKITDGTNTAAVKAASTAAAAADPSLVVALSPNSPIPTGTNTIGSVKVTDGTTVAGVIAGTTALKTDLSSVAGTATSVAAAGIQKVGIVGNAGATVDSTAAAGAAPTNAVLGSHVFNSTVPAPTAGQAVAQQCDSAGSLCVNTEGRKQTFRMSVRGFTPVASATSPLFSIQGSATKTVRITHIKISWSCTTGAALPNDISLQKFSVLTGGTTGNTPTGAKNDTNNAAQTAVCLQYSAVPTTATAIGGISAVERMSWITAGATVNSLYPPIDWQFGNLNGQELVLRGTSEFYGIVVAAVGTTPLMSIWIEWTEE